MGEGENYERIFAEAEWLVPLFYPSGVGDGSGNFGLGLIGSIEREGRYHRFRPSIIPHTRMTIEEVRAVGIGLLVYAAAQEKVDGT